LRLHERQHVHEFYERFRFFPFPSRQLAFTILPVEKILKPIIESPWKAKLLPLFRKVKFKKNRSSHVLIPEFRVGYDMVIIILLTSRW